MGLVRHCIAFLVLLGACLFAIRAHSQSVSKKTDSLKRVIQNSKDDTSEVKNLLELSGMLSCDDTVNKIKFATEALHLAEKLNWNKGKTNADMKLGDIYESCTKNHLLSIQYFQEVVYLTESTGDKITEEYALASVAYDYERLTQYNNAIGFYRRALALRQSPEIELGILGNVGNDYINIGDYIAALDCYDSALKALDEFVSAKRKSSVNDTLHKAGLLITIGDIYLAMSQYEKALENYKKALELSEQTKNNLSDLLAQLGIGKTYRLKKEYDEAIKSYNKALLDCDEPKNTRNETNVLNQLGEVYLEKSDINGAMEYSQKALKLAEQNNYIDQLHPIYTTLGKIYTAQHNYKQAVLYLQKALAICGKNCSLIGEKDAWEALSNTYEQMKQPALAFDAYRHFIAIRDSVYNIGKANELTRIDLQSEYGRKQMADSLRQSVDYRLKMQKQKVYTYSSFAGLAAVLLVSFFIYRNYSQQKRANVAISRANETIKDEKQVSEKLLLNILPEDVARELKTQGSVQAKLFDHVTVLFTDFVNFTEAGERFSPQGLVAELHTCFKAFDIIISKYNIEKIKTVGDAYLAVSGLPTATPGHAAEVVKAAIEIRDFIAERRKQLGDQTFDIRIGVNSGTVVAGIVGVKKFAYDIWGDTVNIAARIEQYSEPGKINISQSTYELIKDQFTCNDRGEIDAKHKGKLKMYYVEA